MRITKISSVHSDEVIEARFQMFLTDMEVASNRYGIAVRCFGGIQTFKPSVERVVYDGEFSSGDVMPVLRRK